MAKGFVICVNNPQEFSAAMLQVLHQDGVLPDLIPFVEKNGINKIGDFLSQIQDKNEDSPQKYSIERLLEVYEVYESCSNKAASFGCVEFEEEGEITTKQGYFTTLEDIEVPINLTGGSRVCEQEDEDTTDCVGRFLPNSFSGTTQECIAEL